LSVGTTSSYYHHIDSISSLQKELRECISEVEQIEEASRATDSSKKKDWLKITEEEQEEHQEKVELHATLDGYFIIHNNADCK
jgi:hypothetical protein